jgi:hypothetical protein
MGSQQISATRRCYEKCRRRISSKKHKLLEPKDLPKKKEYLADSHSNPIGLRVGLHHPPAGKQRGPERESHHITQFLLVQYFHNDSNRKPFQLLDQASDLYPGVSAKGSGIETDINAISHKQIPDSNLKNTINIGPMVDKRGGTMPAILIARTTHRRGRLHVNPSAEDFGEEVKLKSQSEAVDHIFRSNLPSGFKAAEKKTEDFLNYRNKQKDKEVSKQIYSAAQKTYQWMANYMQPRLKQALLSIEKEFYDGLAERANITDRLSDSDLVVCTIMLWKFKIGL